VHEDLFERTVELFYEAAAVPELWPQALNCFAFAVGAMGVNLLPIRPGPESMVCSPGVNGILRDFIESGWLTTNSYMRQGMELTLAGKRGLITSEEMLTPEEYALLLQPDAFYANQSYLAHPCH
jgi:hypothetical protein